MEDFQSKFLIGIKTNKNKTEKMLHDFEPYVWNHKTVTMVLSIPRNIQRLDALFENVKQHHFPKPFVHYGVPAPLGSDNKRVSESITRNHYHAIKMFNHWNSQRSFAYDVMIMEDDCRFVVPKAHVLLQGHLDYLNKNKDWTTLHVGHCPLGPVFPIRNGLIRTTFPWCAHCYVLKGTKIHDLLQKIPEKKWKRARVLEGWLTVPWSQKFAVSPSLATQSEIPKEIKHVPIVNRLNMEKTWYVFDMMMFIIPFLIVSIVTILLWKLVARKILK